MKHPHVKVGDKEYKKIFNRRLRRIKDDDMYYDFPDGNAYKKANQPWDIVDYSCSSDWDDFKSWYGYDKFENDEEAYSYWRRHYGTK
jgi:hypothetical protein